MLNVEKADDASMYANTEIQALYRLTRPDPNPIRIHPNPNRTLPTPSPGAIALTLTLTNQREPPNSLLP